MNNKGNYGLFTAITMIAGTVIGSGIFFKSDDVLRYTNGNMVLGLLVFCIAAIAIIFGCLAISQLATRTDKPGGMIAYAEEFINPKVASAFGWFQIFLYFPTSIAVVAWVSGMYTCQLFGIDGSNLVYCYIGAGFLVAFCAINMLTARLGAIFQNSAMIIKLIPLLLFAAVGMIWGNPTQIVSDNVELMKTTAVGTAWFAAFAPIAFSFDGWIVATNISHEIRDAKRNLPLALIFAPILVLAAYLLYFAGLTSYVGPDVILEKGDAAVAFASMKVMGPMGAKAVLVFIIVSVLGTLNGLYTGLSRQPYSLAIRGFIPCKETLGKESKRFNNNPVNAGVFATVIVLFWLVVHYFTVEAGMQGDVSEIAVCVSYLNYSALYVIVMKLTRKGEIKNKFMGYFVPVMAMVGAAVILLGAMSNPLFPLYLLICFTVMAVGYYYAKQVLAKTN